MLDGELVSELHVLCEDELGVCNTTHINMSMRQPCGCALVLEGQQRVPNTADTGSVSGNRKIEANDACTKTRTLECEVN